MLNTLFKNDILINTILVIIIICIVLMIINNNENFGASSAKKPINALLIGAPSGAASKIIGTPGGIGEIGGGIRQQQITPTITPTTPTEKCNCTCTCTCNK